MPQPINMSETPAEYYVSKAPKPLRGMDYLRKRVQNWFLDLNSECRCYAIGIGIVTAAAVAALFKHPDAVMFVQVGAFVFALGLLPVIERLYEWAWRKLIGKLLIAALIALATNLAYGVGRQMVGALVGTSPEPFSATVNVATILISPVLFLMVLAVGGIIIFGIALAIGPMALMAFSSFATSSRGRRITNWICRFAALAILAFGSWSLLNRSNGYAGWVGRRAIGYLYTFDMYRDTHYATGKTEKVALLGDRRILIGSWVEDGKHYQFMIKHPGERASE